MLCPSNSARSSKAIEELLSSPLGEFANSTCFDRLGSEPFTDSSGILHENVARQILSQSAAPSSAARAAIVTKKMVEEGYNTNYAASWFMVRSEFNLAADGNPVGSLPGCADNDPRGRNLTKGPLKLRSLDSAQATGSTVPLLCDASPTGYLSASVAEIAAKSLYATPIVGGPIGNVLELDLDGDGVPETANPNYLKTPRFSAGTGRNGPSGWNKQWNFYTRQDYRGIMPLHNGIANCLMADGSVQQLYDPNRDQFVNNGFDVPTGPGSVLWTSKDIEVDKRKLASFHSLKSNGPVQ
jgi:prepilin-type processing-associated H-X9-DG protein